jgi:FkbM family methyltransferase
MLKIVKRCVLNASRSLGYDIVPLRSVKERDFAIHLRQLFDLLAVDCVFDVGANVGQYRDFLREQVLYDGPIVSFEPIVRNAEILRERSRSDPDWFIEACALGPEPGTRALHVMKSDQFSSFLEPEHSVVPDFAELNVPTHVESAEVRTLDDMHVRLQGRLGFNHPYLKLDTQGFDLQVLRGGETALRAVSALQTEASLRQIYKDMPHYTETSDFLAARGFDVTGIYPVSRDPLLRLIEFDCVMINRDLVRGSN